MKTLARRKTMPKKTWAKSKYEYRYAPSLHKKIAREAKREGITHGELLTLVFKDWFKRQKEGK